MVCVPCHYRLQPFYLLRNHYSWCICLPTVLMACSPWYSYCCLGIVYHDYDIFVNSHPHIDDYLAGTSVNNDIVNVYIIIYLTIIFHRNNNIVLSKRVLLKSWWSSSSNLRPTSSSENISLFFLLKNWRTYSISTTNCVSLIKLWRKQ